MIVAVADALGSIFIRMKFLKIILLAFYILFGCGFVAGQENTNTPERTPEQEAARQTEKMQQELNLTPEQAQQVHEINLKYARERQVSNSRTEALQRVKNKEQDLRKVLKPAQYNELQNKQYERSTPNPAIRRKRDVLPASVRPKMTLVAPLSRVNEIGWMLVTPLTILLTPSNTMSIFRISGVGPRAKKCVAGTRLFIEQIND